MSKDQKNILPDASQLGAEVAAWTMGEYSKPRSDTGQLEARVDVSVERLGHAVKAVLATHMLEAADKVLATSPAVRSVLAEREKQKKRWGDDHDTGHGSGQLAQQALGYIDSAPVSTRAWAHKSKVVDRDPRRTQLVKGVALALAAIECMDREEAARLEKAAQRAQCRCSITPVALPLCERLDIQAPVTKRYIQVLSGGKWWYTSMDQIKKGDVFRMFDPTVTGGHGVAVVGQQGETMFHAQRDAEIVQSLGVWSVVTEPYNTEQVGDGVPA